MAHQTKLVDLGFAMARLKGSPSGYVNLVVCAPAWTQDGVHEPPQSVSVDLSPECVKALYGALVDASAS